VCLVTATRIFHRCLSSRDTNNQVVFGCPGGQVINVVDTIIAWRRNNGQCAHTGSLCSTTANSSLMESRCNGLPVCRFTGSVLSNIGWHCVYSRDGNFITVIYRCVAGKRGIRCESLGNMRVWLSPVGQYGRFSWIKMPKMPWKTLTHSWAWDQFCRPNIFQSMNFWIQSNPIQSVCSLLRSYPNPSINSRY